uniref:Aspartyl/asparaginy/proline hydroxylase domain-containing protein n=1 Tax=Clytia hemisphaerica TaxID=252671 RepID=A0A7M5X3A4_9CNID
MSIWVENDLSDEWSKFYFLNQGAVQNEEECPQSNNILNRCQNLMTDCLFGYQFFSILNPGSKIDPHTGPTNVRLRCHVSLQIPVANPKSLNMNVNGVKVTWKDDEVILFDDSFQHHVVYNSKGNSGVPRVVLLLDFWHPDLTEAERTCLQTCFSPANIN